MRRSVVAIGVVLSFGACGGSTGTTHPEPEPAPASIAAIEAEPEPPASQDGDESSTEVMGPDQIKLGVDKLNPGIKAAVSSTGSPPGPRSWSSSRT